MKFVRSSGYFWWTSGSRDNPMWANFGKQNGRRPSPSPPCPFKTCPCVRSKRPHVYRQHAYMLKHMCGCCRHARGRFGCTHRGFQRATPHTPHHDHNDTHNTTRQSETERHRERRQKEREEKTEEERQDKKRQQKTRQDKRRRDKTRRQETRWKRKWKRILKRWSRDQEKTKRNRDKKRWKQRFYSKNENSQVRQMNWISKVQNLTVFFIIYTFRIGFFGPRELIERRFRAA